MAQIKKRRDRSYHLTIKNDSSAILGASGGNKGDITATKLQKWRAWRDSNPQPSDPKSEALSG